MANNQFVFALLIDGDNVQTKHIPPILDKLPGYGEVLIAKVFHDKMGIVQWEQIPSHHAIEPIWVPNNSKSKNSVDIALVMDAMELLYTRPEVTGFCIVSSDGDYTRLARYLKTQGKFVLGIGEEKTPPPFRVACSEFIQVETLIQQTPPVKQAAAKPAKPKKESTEFDRLREAFIYAVDVLKKADKKGWVDMAVIGGTLRELFPKHQPLMYRNQKHSQLKKVVEQMMVDYPQRIELNANGKSLYLRMQR
jgi:uncharacterized LabA/DUF88 family protein